MNKDEIRSHAIELRRRLHRVPEVAFDLPKTLKIVKGELDRLGIPYAEGVGRSGIVATVNAGSAGKTIALRADMDALPIKEETGLPFASEHEGRMHACGHDCHTAILLTVAEVLKECEDTLPCRVKLIFQPAEEAAPGGAKLMCEDGAMDGVDAIFAGHINPGLDCGKIAFNYGRMYANSHGFLLTFHGKSCHVCSPQCGVDAIAMAIRAYTDIQIMKARELNPREPSVIGIGEIHGGEANNIVCDKVTMHGTVRTLSDSLDEKIFSRIEQIADSVSRDMGGSYTLVTTKHYPSLVNDSEMASYLKSCAIETLGAQNVYDDRQYTLAAEDFSFYLKHARGAFFSIGAGKDNCPPFPLHNSRFTVDEEGLAPAVDVFVSLVKNFK